ncbi:hypothetical protein KP509_25G017700 [Ceratopteris richardii]|uniref:Cytochrome P450 n=1 Tax=Ceratopteris richardii TaxID=49495 RepID=A0A8T2RN91_CERRI|nr:hypothetical protein KP509_25G017700 [Ceratopteris richardii]
MELLSISSLSWASMLGDHWVLATVLLAVIACLVLPIVLQPSPKGADGKPLRLPPSPRALPIIGHMHLLDSSPHAALYRLSKVYGPLMFLKLGAVPVVVASSAEMARQILQVHDQTFCSRPQYFTVPALIFKYTDILFSSPGPYWKLMREICVTDLFSNKRLEYFRPVRVEEVHGMVRSVLSQVGSLVNVRDELHSASSNIIARITLGKRMPELSVSSRADPSCNIVQIIREVAHLLGAFNVGDYLPWLRWMDLQGLAKHSKDVHRKATIVFQEVIDNRRKDNRTKDETLLDLLLTAALDSKKKDLQISDETIRAVLLEIFAAGIDTGSVTIEWALMCLIINPNEMKKVQEELDRVVGHRLVEEADIPNLPYLQAATKEAMRLHPVGPLLMPHMSSRPCNINGHEIPANTIAFVNTWAIGRDPALWKDPQEYRPERFVDSNIDVRGHHFELLPFSSGRRGCPAWRLGLLNVYSILGNLVHGFNWTIPGEPDLTEETSIVLALKHPLKAYVSPRLPEHVYA